MITVMGRVTIVKLMGNDVPRSFIYNQEVGKLSGGSGANVKKSCSACFSCAFANARCWWWLLVIDVTWSVFGRGFCVSKHPRMVPEAIHFLIRFPCQKFPIV